MSLVELIDLLQLRHVVVLDEGHFLVPYLALLCPLLPFGPEQVEFASYKTLLVVVIERLCDAAEHEQYHKYDSSRIAQQLGDGGIADGIAFE